MKRFVSLFVFLLTIGINVVLAQEVTEQFTLFREFKPAKVYMSNGKVVKTSHANIFLKNASLLFLRGELTMEANMETIDSVDIENRRFVKIDKMLYEVVDSVGKNNNKLFCAIEIDIPAYNTMLKNNQNITSLSGAFSGAQLSYSTIDLSKSEDIQMPIVPHYYYLYNGELIRVHEREISRRLPKDKEIRRMYKTIISMNDFTWVDKESLMKLLKAISE